MRALVNDYQASVNTAVCETFCQTWCSAIDFAEVYFKRVYQGNLTRATDQHAAQCQAHCLDCALNQAIQHEHTLCEDCAIAWAPIACVAFVAKNDAVTADMRKRAEHIQEDFTLYVGHLVRERWSKQVREDIMWSLGLDEVMITIDWAMKWLPMRQLETQREWFGQRGLSWHCASVIRSTDGGKTFEISYIDFVMREDGQTWADVLQALQHILSLVKMEFPAITKVKLFADNAGCYSSNMIYANLRTLGDPIGIKICAFYHSESQAGKTEVDSHLGNKKREVRADVCTADADAPQAPTSRKDAATPTELYARLSSLCHRGEYAGLVSPRDHPAAGQPGGPAVKAETEKLFANRRGIPDVSKICVLLFNEHSVDTYEAAGIGVRTRYSIDAWSKFEPSRDAQAWRWHKDGDNLPVPAYATLEHSAHDPDAPSRRAFAPKLSPAGAVVAAPAQPALIAAPAAPAPVIVQPLIVAAQPPRDADAEAAGVLNALAEGPIPVIACAVAAAPGPAAAPAPAQEAEERPRKRALKYGTARPTALPAIGYLLRCPTRGCRAGPFVTDGNLQRHIALGKHDVPSSHRDFVISCAQLHFAKPVVNESKLFASAAAKIAALREASTTRPEQWATHVAPWMSLNLVSGWGRRRGARATRKSERMLEFLQALFDAGLATIDGRKARKVTPQEAVDRMASADPPFDSSELLDVQKVKQHFSQLATKKKAAEAREAQRRTATRVCIQVASDE